MTLKIGSPPWDFPSLDSLARWLYQNKLCTYAPSYCLKYLLFNLIASSIVHCNSSTVCEKQVLYGPSEGVISSPGYPKGYSNHLSCTWTIKNIQNSLLKISFEDVDIENVNDIDCGNFPCCKYNWLKIGTFHNSNVHVLCGHDQQPDPIYTHDETIWLKFHIRNLRKGGRGFKIKYFLESPNTTPFTECKINEYRCDNGQCIFKSLLCNGVSNCQDKSDETHCPSKNACPQNMTSCGSSSHKCYTLSQKCDGIFHCPNGEDEIDCVDGCKNKIKCNSLNACYDWRDRCNGISECSDYSDEKNCDAEQCRSENGAYLCNNLRCIRESWLCDQANDCGDNSDEQNCIKNSVITAAVIGSLICGLLLVIAIGCTCKLYALRVQDNRNSRCASILSHLEREVVLREPPPSYTLAINDPSAHYFQQAHFGMIESQCYSSRHRLGRRIRRLRRHRRRPPTPPPQVLPAVHESNNSGSNDSLSPNSSLSVTEASSLHSIPNGTNDSTDETNIQYPLANFDSPTISTLSYIQEIDSKTENNRITESNSSNSMTFNHTMNVIEETNSEEPIVLDPSVYSTENTLLYPSPAFDAVVCASCHSLNSSYPNQVVDTNTCASSHSSDSLSSLILQGENTDQMPLLFPKS